MADRSAQAMFDDVEQVDRSMQAELLATMAGCAQTDIAQFQIHEIMLRLHSLQVRMSSTVDDLLGGKQADVHRSKCRDIARHRSKGVAGFGGL